MNKLLFGVLHTFAIVVSLSINANSQVYPEPNSVLVHGEITGEGSYSVHRNDIKGLFVKLTITNATELEKNFLIMSCSWMDNWQTDNQNLTLFYPGCDKNVPESIVLKPHKSIVFYGFLTRKVENKADINRVEYTSPRPPYDKWTVPAAGARVRFGFTERYPDSSPSNSTYNRLIKYDSYSTTTWWSQPVSLQFDNNTFLVED